MCPYARRCVLSAAIGGVIFRASLLFPLPTDIVTSMIQRLLTMGPLVVIPLGLSLVPPTDAASPAQKKLYSVAVRLQLPFAVAAVASLFVAPGWLGVGLANFGLTGCGFIWAEVRLLQL